MRESREPAKIRRAEGPPGEAPPGRGGGPPGESGAPRRGSPPGRRLRRGAALLASLLLPLLAARFLGADPTEYATGLGQPNYLAVDPNGAVYVGGGNSMPAVAPWLKKYVGPATLDPNWAPVPGALPNGIAVDGSGCVHVLEGSAQIVKYDPSGNIAASPIPLPAGVSGQQPHGLGLDADGAYYVTTWGNHKVYRISPDATGAATDLGFPDLPPGGGVRTPNGLFLDPNSSGLYAASAVSDNSNFVHSAPLPAPGSPAVWTQVNGQNNGAGVYYLNIAADGTHFYVTDTAGKRLYRMARTENAAPELLQALGSNPGGVAVDGSGYVYLVARGSGTDDGKIYRLAPGGATATPAPTSAPTATPAPTAQPTAAATAAPTRTPTATPGATATPAPSVTLYPSPSVAIPTPAIGVTGAVPLTSPSPLPTDAPPLTPGPPGATLRIAQDALRELFGFEDPQLQLVHGDGYRWIFDLQGSSTFSIQVRTERTEEGGYVYLYTIFLRSGDEWVALANGSASGARGAGAANARVLQRFDVADNGSFDFDARAGYVEIQAMEALLAAPRATATPASGGGSGGCSAGWAVPSLILLATPLAFLVRRKR